MKKGEMCLRVMNGNGGQVSISSGAGRPLLQRTPTERVLQEYLYTTQPHERLSLSLSLPSLKCSS